MFSRMVSLLVAVLALVALAAGCGSSDDKKDDGKGKDLAKSASALCSNLDGAAGELAKEPGTRVVSSVAKTLEQTITQAAVVADDADEVGGSAGDYGKDSATAAKDGATKLQKLPGDSNEEALKTALAAKVDYDECVGDVEKLAGAVDGSTAGADLSGKGFDELIDSLEKAKVKADAKKADAKKAAEAEQTQTTTSGPGGGESSDLPLCSAGPPPCRADDGSVQEGEAPGGGGGSGESADLPECSAGVTPCRNSDGSIKP